MQPTHELIELDAGVSLLVNGEGELFGILSEKDLLDQPDLLNRARARVGQFQKLRGPSMSRMLLRERLATLSAREHEVCDLLVAAQHTKEIARQLEISTKTVEFHRANILRKMHAECVVELVRMLLARDA